MADLAGALSTDVYLEGLDLKGNKIGKAKVALRNNPDIAKGDIKLSFLAHNESAETRNYDVTLTVMRPALAQPNNIVTKDYNFKGEIDDIKNLSGMAYFDTDVRRMEIASGSIAYKDAVKASKDIEYYATEEAWKADQADIAAGKHIFSPELKIRLGFDYDQTSQVMTLLFDVPPTVPEYVNYVANLYNIPGKGYVFNGVILETDNNVPYGTVPTYDGAEPQRIGDGRFDYAFKGWSPEVGPVTGDITYVATFTSNIKRYTVTWLNYDGSTLEVDENVAYGSIPTYGQPSTASKPNSKK